MMVEKATRDELEHELQTFQAELEEVDEMRRAVLGQTGVHVGARLLAQHMHGLAL